METKANYVLIGAFTFRRRLLQAGIHRHDLDRVAVHDRGDSLPTAGEPQTVGRRTGYRNRGVE